VSYFANEAGSEGQKHT